MEETIGRFWEDKQILKTFSVSDALNRCIELLGGKEGVDKLLKIVNKADEREFNQNQAFFRRQRPHSFNWAMW
jgi:hypothetical protein